jgi:hypothetical protein
VGFFLSAYLLVLSPFCCRQGNDGRAAVRGFTSFLSFRLIVLDSARESGELFVLLKSNGWCRRPAAADHPPALVAGGLAYAGNVSGKERA